ncbi:MAG: hypothetical protein Q8882_05305 [Bacillota bacterium]|nr:hypothetical protein [Bacillota bacterium]
MKTINKGFLLVLMLIVAITLGACGNTGEKPAQDASKSSASQAQPLDLTGNWKQSNSNSKTSYQSAVIQGSTIEVYWVNEEDSSKSLYWAGTYIAPTTSDKKYSWDSANDKTKTETSLLASGDDTKTFSYNDGVLSYSVSAMGTTKTVELKKQ